MALRRSQMFLQEHELVETVDAKGKIHRRYVYRGDVYERRITDGQRRAERYADVLTALLAGTLAVLAAVQRTPVNARGFFAVLSMLNMVPVLCVLMGAGASFFQTGRLTRSEHDERRLLLRAMPLASVAFLLILAVGYAVHGAWLAFGAALGAAALYAAMGVHECKVKFIVHPGTAPSGEEE